MIDNHANPSAKVIADSISPTGIRLTTLEVDMHRFVLPEANTHRVFSRNSASSRAIPVEKNITAFTEKTWYPLSWTAEQRGMSGGSELTGQNLEDAQALFEDIRNFTSQRIQEYIDTHDKEDRVHKSLINRLMEWGQKHTVIITATEWDGFFHQRRHKDAQPEIRIAADAMYEALESSVPNLIDYGEWHLPFITEADRDEIYHFHGITDRANARRDDGAMGLILSDLKKISAARCARTSYLTHDGKRSLDKDLDLYAKLAIREENPEDPIHWSPLEHVATPCTKCRGAGHFTTHPGNFNGWFQMRHEQDITPYA